MWAFEALQRPDGKWRLTTPQADHGVYDTLKDVEEAIQRILKPKRYRYDERGMLIK